MTAVVARSERDAEMLAHTVRSAMGVVNRQYLPAKRRPSSANLLAVRVSRCMIAFDPSVDV